MSDPKTVANQIIDNVGKVIVGKQATLELAIIGLLCQGHLLIEDVPGVGKTMLAKSLAKSIGCEFRRIQFTPDMLPSDVTGVRIFDQRSREFVYQPGPIQANIVLADEINRATPKTQAALLEAMEERQVTIDGETHRLEPPFMVLATQNPIEYEGTFPLPEAQLDRFLLRLRLGYPDPQHEIAVLDSQQRVHPIESLGQVISKEELLAAQAGIREVYVDVLVKTYIVEIVTRTRKHTDVYLGASPRGSLTLFRSGQARAALEGRDYVIPDDIKALAPFALAHRMIVSPSARIKDVDAETIVRDILASVPVPGGSVKP
ncbi:MAG TPA: MoxR family ATPase, partial [Anaerolineae bacterium]|nr:MoxR family ATPase [Anaerolineae bacterium]